MISTPKRAEFSERLRKARELRDLTQAELAKKARLPVGAISHFEVGSRKPSFENLRRLADALGVTTDFLLGRVDEPRAVGSDLDTLYRHWSKLSSEDQEVASSLLESLAKRRNAKRGEPGEDD